MKCYKNNIFTVILIIITIVAFSSCHVDDYYWKKGTLDVNFDLNLDYYGYAQVFTTVRIQEIPELNLSREDLTGLRTNDAWLEISNLRRNDYIERFYIEVAGVGTYAYETPISIRTDGEVITIDDNTFFNYMSKVNAFLYRDGAVDMKITFYSRIYDGGPIYFDIKNNLDLEIRG
jgi:hypothetical protein